jgi:hypothetical protein
MTVDYTQLGAAGAIVIVVLLFLNYMRTDSNKRDRTYNRVAKALDRLTVATNKNIQATVSADTYLKQRNGRDIESHQETLKSIQEIPTTLRKIAEEQSKSLLKAVEVKEQHVEHQHVETETVEHKTDKG